MNISFLNKDFAKAIRQQRVVELQANIRPIAKKIGISPATLSRCERERAPDLMTYFKVCEWLGADPTDFIKGYGKSWK